MGNEPQNKIYWFNIILGIFLCILWVLGWRVVFGLWIDKEIEPLVERLLPFIAYNNLDTAIRDIFLGAPVLLLVISGKAITTLKWLFQLPTYLLMLGISALTILILAAALRLKINYYEK